MACLECQHDPANDCCGPTSYRNAGQRHFGNPEPMGMDLAYPDQAPWKQTVLFGLMGGLGLLMYRSASDGLKDGELAPEDANDFLIPAALTTGVALFAGGISWHRYFQSQGK